MTKTIRIGKAGRVVLPKAVRDRMRLEEGSLLSLELVGDKIVLSHEATEREVEERGGKRVIVGWDGFDAAAAVREDREARLERVRPGEGN